MICSPPRLSGRITTIVTRKEKDFLEEYRASSPPSLLTPGDEMLELELELELAIRRL